MSGSFGHIVDDITGEFRFDLIEHMGEAHEALEECYYIIKELVGGDFSKLKKLKYKANIPDKYIKNQKLSKIKQLELRIKRLEDNWLSNS
jgi:hypothetical protein